MEQGAGLGGLNEDFDGDDVTGLNRVMADMQADQSNAGFVTVYRMAGAGRSGEYLKRYMLDEIETDSLLDVVRDTFGAGKYQFSVYNTTGGLKARKVIALAAIPGAMKKSEAMNQDAMEKLSQTMLAGFERIAASNKPASDTSEEAVLKKMAMYRDLFGSPKTEATSGAQGAQELLAAMMQGIRLANSIKSGEIVAEEKTEDWLERMMTMFGEPIMNALANKQKQGAVVEGSAQVSQSNPAQRGQSQSEVKHESEASVGNSNNSENSVEDVSVVVKFYIKKLVGDAQAGHDPLDTAERVYVMLDGDVEMLESDDWFARLCQVVPECGSHKEWFVKLRDEVLAISQTDQM